MKKRYVMTDTGVLVLATAEQLADDKVPKIDVEFPDPVSSNDAVSQLTATIREMSTGFAAIKELVEQQKTALEAYKEAAKKGFAIPGAPSALPAPAGMDEGSWDLAKQGKRLMDKLHHPSYQISDEKRLILAEYFTLFLRAGVLNDPRAWVKFHEKYGMLSAERKTALGDAGNVFPVPDIVDSEILTFAREKSVVLQYARQWDMTSEKQSFPAEETAVTVSWGNTTQASDPGVTEVELTANELSAYSTVKNTTLADARSDIVSWLTEALSEAAGLELDNQAFNGTGSPFVGLLGSTCGYSVVMTGSAFSQLTATELSSMIAKLDGLKKQGARFWMHGQGLHFVRSLKDDNGRPIFIETIGAPMSGTIWGFPYTEVIKMPSSSASNTAWMNFGNLRYLAVGRRLDVSALSVDPYGLWTTNRTRFKLYQRWGMTMGLPKGFVRLLTKA